VGISQDLKHEPGQGAISQDLRHEAWACGHEVEPRMPRSGHEAIKIRIYHSNLGIGTYTKILEPKLWVRGHEPGYISRRVLVSFLKTEGSILAPFK
jgi:hypothetical protein